MNNFIDISNNDQLKHALEELGERDVPLWGKMRPQQMIEHLIENVEYTNGKYVFTCELPVDEAAINKQKWIYTPVEIPKNVILAGLPAYYRYSNLEAAIRQLITEVADFHQHFTDGSVTVDHLAYGAMNYREWLVWHGKHFTHHFKQFNLTWQ